MKIRNLALAGLLVLVGGSLGGCCKDLFCKIPACDPCAPNPCDPCAPAAAAPAAAPAAK